MTSFRACEPCRTAKARCDLVRPSCGRCAQRSLTCAWPVEAGLTFRDENEVARRNSERARRSLGDVRVVATSSRIMPLWMAQQRRLPQPSAEDNTGAGLRELFPWLNDVALAGVPEPLKRDLETRAVERFFVNWTLYPSNDGVSPGHMHNLSALYASSPPGSVLWLAVRAVAFADMRGYPQIPFSTRARETYGAALTRMRELAGDEQRLADDRILAALLLIDNFELMYLSRAEPLGPHKDAVRHLLDIRGDNQLYHRPHFALWQMAHHRLQARQILLREEPEESQLTWLSKLNVNRPDIRISVDIMRMIILCAAARTLTQGGETILDTIGQKGEQARELARTIQECIDSIESWTSEMSPVWKPQPVDPSQFVGPDGNENQSTLPIPYFTCPHVLSYHDVWMAYIWNFHAASQIVLRESLVEIITYTSTLGGQQEPNAEDAERIGGERQAIDRLSTIIIESFPPLLGFMHDPSKETIPLRQGKMAGRFFALFSMWVVQKAAFTIPKHKQTAFEVTAWISSSHGLS